MRIGIIGTAGRKEARYKLNKKIYTNMVYDAKEQISLINTEKESIHLKSGGAAYADHITISLYLMNIVQSLTLYLPCKWSNETSIFVGDKTADIANYYHKLFSEKLGGNSLLGIQAAINKGAKYHEVTAGFHARNLLVGRNLNVLIAYTFGEGNAPADGGTLHTWNNSNAPIKLHRNIISL